MPSNPTPIRKFALGSGVEMAEMAIGIYRGNASLIAAGQWDLVIEGVAAGRRMFLSKNRVVLN